MDQAVRRVGRPAMSLGCLFLAMTISTVPQPSAGAPTARVVIDSRKYGGPCFWISDHELLWLKQTDHFAPTRVDVDTGKQETVGSLPAELTPPAPWDWRLSSDHHWLIRETDVGNAPKWLVIRVDGREHFLPARSVPGPEFSQATWTDRANEWAEFRTSRTSAKIVYRKLDGTVIRQVPVEEVDSGWGFLTSLEQGRALLCGPASKSDACALARLNVTGATAHASRYWARLPKGREQVATSLGVDLLHNRIAWPLWHSELLPGRRTGTRGWVAELWVSRVDGSDMRFICPLTSIQKHVGGEVGYVTGLSWSPSGRLLLFQRKGFWKVIDMQS